MNNRQYKKLELTWYNKDKILLWDDEQKEYVWVEPNDIRVGEPRILIEKKIIGKPDSLFNSSTGRWEKTRKPLPKEEQNLLIFGDNLLALKSLESDFFERIKLVYIDPPFNTERDDLNYPDGIEHSHWLSMMRNRLEIIWELLSWEGAIFVHINDIEHAYLQVLLDEIFQRKNYVITISVKASSAAGHKTINPTPVNVTEYILVYAKDKSQWEYKPQYIAGDYDPMYNNYIENKKDHYSKWKIGPIQDFVAKKLGYKNVKEIKQKMGTKLFMVSVGEFALEYHESVFESTAINYSGVGKETQKLYDLSVKNPDKIYYQPREKHNDIYILNRRRMTFYTTKIKKVNGKEAPAQLLTNLWNDIGWHGIAKEGGVTLNRGKKPEKLLKRILEIGTEPGDWVLDSFAGSGTTGAVAHKMGRKWIMIECLPDQIKLCLTRLTNVVKGKDTTGITKIVKFKSGGGFRYCELGKSLFKKDDMGIVEVTYDNGPLIEAICKIEGFKFVGREFVNKTKLHGVVNGIRYCHITEEFVTQYYVDEVSAEIRENESLVIYCLGYQSKLKLPPNIEIKKIPMDVAKKFRLNSNRGKRNGSITR